MWQQVRWHVGARREVRGLPCHMPRGGGSGVKSWINCLPAISPQGQTGRLSFCYPVIDIKSSLSSKGRMPPERMSREGRRGQNFLQPQETRRDTGHQKLPAGRDLCAHSTSSLHATEEEGKAQRGTVASSTAHTAGLRIQQTCFPISHLPRIPWILRGKQSIARLIPQTRFPGLETKSILWLHARVVSNFLPKK